MSHQNNLSDGKNYGKLEENFKFISPSQTQTLARKPNSVDFEMSEL